MIRAYRPFTKTLRALSLLMAALALLFVSAAALAQTMASSVSQHGITWYFDQEYQVGQYANGDWWVLGPATIVNITPESRELDGRVINGSMVNPTDGHGQNSQGYDSHNSDMPYRSDLNVAPNYTGQNLSLVKGSVSSSISKPTPRASGRPLLDNLAILTVVEEVPPNGAFRPHPYGTDKTSYWAESQLDYGILQNLPHVPDMPSLEARSAQALRFWNEHNTNWQQRAVQASNNQPLYGRNIANQMSEMLLLLHLDFTQEQKRDLFVGVVQYGLDIYGRAKSGGVWEDAGGHNHGRKMPLILAGLALNDPDILEYGDAAKHFIFQEDRQTFYVSQDDVDRERFTGDGRPREPFTEDMIGMPEWGPQHTLRPERDGSNWGLWYRWVGASIVPHVLMAHLTPGAENVWNWPATFDYADRFFATDTVPPTDTNGIQAFQRSMWEAYRDITLGNPVARPESPTIMVE